VGKLKWLCMLVCSMMRRVRTIITIILCIYECICYFQARNNVKYESTWCSFHELVENCPSFCYPECMGPLPSVDFAVRCVLQLKCKRVMKVRSDA
jgi:hypothetical protein